MPASATGGSAASQKRVHSRSPYRDALEMMLAARGNGRGPVFGITEERSGSAIIPLFRGEVPVCDEFPSADAAFDELTSRYTAFAATRARVFREITEGAVSPQKPPVAPGPIQETAEPPTRRTQRRRAS